MSETSQSKPSGVTIHRVQHVSLVRPYGDAAAAQARHFYGTLLGCDELEVPDSLAGLNLLWFRLGGDELHLTTDDTQPGEHGQHLCLEVDDVARLRDYLADLEIEIVDAPAIPNRPRFFCRDPFGNAVEFTSIQGPYR